MEKETDNKEIVNDADISCDINELDFSNEVETDFSDDENNFDELHTVEHSEGFTRVVCPRCGSINIEFVTEYHKFIWQRFIAIVFGIIAVAILLLNLGHSISEASKVICIILAIISVSFLLSAWLGERKTHIQGVCRDCGFIWYMN